MKRPKYLIFIIFPVLLTIFIVRQLAFNKAIAAWFDESWLYRTALTFTNTGSADSNKKVKFDIDTATLYSAGKIQIDCDDSRFTDANGNLLQYYLDTANGACNTNSTDYYVLVPTINAGSNLIYHYYGNTSAAKGSVASQFSQATFTQGATSAAAEEKSPGPVAYWKFDEGTGITANDSSGNGNNGSLGTGSSAPTWQTEDMCISGKCLRFDGSNDYVYTQDIDTLGNFTYEAWVKLASTPTGNNFIFDKEIGGSLWPSVWLYISSNNTVIFGFYKSSSTPQNVTTTDTLTINTWYHLTGTYNSSKLAIYINGKFSKDADASGTPNNINNELTIGAAEYNTPPYFRTLFNGSIDQAVIYPYARTAAQIKSDYNAGKAGAGTSKGTSASIGNKSASILSNGLIGYWKMDEASWNGTTGEVLDASGNANHGVGVGSTAPTTGAGKFGNGGVLNGANYVNAADSTSLDPSLITISAWVNLNTGTITYSPIVSKANTATNQGYWLNLNNSRQIRFIVGNASSFVDTTTTDTISNSTWTHIVTTYDGSYSKIYINGALSKTSSQFTAGMTVPTNKTLRIGTDDGPNGYFAGKIDDVRIYNRALSPAEVRQLYDWAPGPKAYLKFEEGSGTSANDSSGNSNTGTLNSGALWKTGKVGKGVWLEGTDDNVSVGDFSY